MSDSLMRPATLTIHTTYVCRATPPNSNRCLLNRRQPSTTTTIMGDELPDQYISYAAVYIWLVWRAVLEVSRAIHRTIWAHPIINAYCLLTLYAVYCTACFALLGTFNTWEGNNLQVTKPQNLIRGFKFAFDKSRPELEFAASDCDSPRGAAPKVKYDNDFACRGKTGQEPPRRSNPSLFPSLSLSSLMGHNEFAPCRCCFG